MDKFFKRTLVCVAVASAATVGTANAAIDLKGEEVQLYGQAAGGLIIANPVQGDSNVTGDIESRLGFRGKVEFDNFAPNFVYQVESGNANAGQQGNFGFRDTYLGLEFEDVGTFKFGRQLVAAYNYVDWPHSNPGLGGVFDASWAPDVGQAFQDRADHVIRFDSATWNGFNFQATASGMEKTTDAMVLSLAGSMQLGNFNVHGGYYHQDEYETTTDASWGFNKDSTNGTCSTTPEAERPNNSDCYGAIAAKTDDAGGMEYWILGTQANFGDLQLTAAVKESKNRVADAKQTSLSATAQYVLDGTWLYKLGVATNGEVEKAGVDQDNTEDLAVTARVGYFATSAFFYTDVRYADMNGSTEDKDGTNIHLGVEFVF